MKRGKKYVEAAKIIRPHRHYMKQTEAVALVKKTASC